MRSPLHALLALVAPTLIALTLIAASPAPAQDAAAEEGPPPLPEAVVDPATPVEDLVLRLTPLTRDELAAAAEAWLALVKEKTQEVVDAQIAAREAADAPGGDAEREKVVTLTEERRRLFASYSTVVDAWERKAGDADQIAAYRAYRTAIVVDETRSADYQTLLKQATAWALSEDGGVGLAIDLAVIAASLAGLIFVARMARRITRRGVARVPNLSKLLQAFFVVLVYWIVLAVGLMVVLSALGLDITPVFALIGGASFILAFALQSTLGNLAAGLMIMINRPFDEGDYVSVAGVAGTVKAVSIMSTTVTTPDNQVIVIPNASVWGDVITNVTTSPERRVDLVFGIGYGDDMGKAQEVLTRLVEAHPLVLDDPAPMIKVGALGASSVDFLVRPWVKGADYWTVYWDLTQQVKAAFDAEGISIPFPQQVEYSRPWSDVAPQKTIVPSDPDKKA
ncbi:MAG: mechanosensitive ion channel family protein [Pseudomonadota bacterium]